MPLLNRRKAAAPDPGISPEGKAFVKELDTLADDVWEEARTIVPAFSAPPDGEKARRTKRVANGFFIGAVALCLALAGVLLLNNINAGLFGLRFFVEPTDAMAPNVPRGALLITVNRKPGQIQAGDIITYNALPYSPDSPRLTRFVDERSGAEEDYRFRTKRPGSVVPDSIVINTTNILGVKLAVLPWAGFAISFVRIYAGAFAAVAAMLCVAAVLLRIWLKPGLPKWFPVRKESKNAQALV